MDPAAPPANPKPSLYQIGGVPVEFPYKPYGTQLAFMGRVIATLERARRQGRSHALLESPTGTGKSLSLLCSSLAWQQRLLASAPANPTPSPPPTPDPLLHGGGFIPEPNPSGNPEQPAAATSKRAQRRLTAPTIYYASRTHSQISQVIREYRKTSYRVPMAILASRKHYCTNKQVCSKENLDEECKLLLKNADVGCTEFKNAHKVKGHPSLQKGGCHEVHDIEDLVIVGRTVKGCSYFAAQALAEEAQLVFCPYSYIMNPIVRRAMDIDIKGSIVILDEAHNIEDMARDAGSLDVEEEVLCMLQSELGQLCVADSVEMIYQPLYDMIQGIITWLGDRKNNLQKREFERYSSYWTGDKAIRELQQAGITRQYFPVLQECATKAIKAASDADSDKAHLSGISSITLEGLFSSLGYFFSGDGCHTFDYQLALQRYVKRDGSNAANGWTCALSLWCLNPAIVFREIANLSLSVILTSGTLSPMGSFASELGVQFEACMEAPHVIDVESQLWAAVIPSGPGNCQLNASYKTAGGYAFQDALGESLEQICRIVPGGVLVFFPSYKLLEKLHLRWQQTGQWDRLNDQKPLFIEPRGSTEDFEHVLKDYYNTVSGSLNSCAKPKRNRKRECKSLSTNKAPQNPVNRGAAFLAVCRGKVSEGIDFSNENARAVVIVGIPFPNKNDIQVELKKKYNDTYKLSKGLLSGSEWYCYQAFRALNQAAGRCIRHRFDYGAIILLDERFKEERNVAYVSKWLKRSIKNYDSFDDSLEGLRNFFKDAEKQLNKKGVNTVQEPVISDINKEILSDKPSRISDHAIPQKGHQTQKKLHYEDEEKMIAHNTIAIARTSNLKSSPPVKRDVALCSQLNKKSVNGYTDYIDLESNFSEYSRYTETCTTSSKSSSDCSLLVEDIENGGQTASPVDTCKIENSFPVVRAISQFPQRSPLCSVSNMNLVGNLSEVACTLSVSPEREVQVGLRNPEPDLFSKFSVNSHCQKRRKFMSSQIWSCNQMASLSSPEAESFCRVNDISTRQTIESPLTDDGSTCEHQKSVQESCMETCNLTEAKLHLCCSSCKNPLGLCENKFLVTCFLASSSKAYLTHVLKHGPESNFTPEVFLKNRQPNVPVVISDTTSVDPQFVNRCNKVYPPHDIWYEPDGCVFRVVSCPFCTLSGTYLGLQIMATDDSNTHLLNKIIFYADRLDVQKEETLKAEVASTICKLGGGEGANMPTEEKSACIIQLMDPEFSCKTKSKLRLPKSRQISSDNQEDPCI